MPSKSRPGTAVDFVTSGTYQRQDFASFAETFANTTEQEVTYVSNVIVAETANKNELFSWVRGLVYLYESAAGSAFEWALVRMDTVDGLPDLNDEPTAEKLHREKRIFARGYVQSANPHYSAPKPVKFEVFNVALNYGEELRLVIKPVWFSGAATSHLHGLIEWRQVGI